MSIYLEDLRKDYHDDNIVPFIGAGLSIPFNVPSWGDIIRSMSSKYSKEKSFINEVVEHDLSANDYWGAVDSIKKFANIDEQEIQEVVSGLIQEKQKYNVEEENHNYSDLKELKFKLYLTTNYDNFLQKHLDYNLYPLELRNAKINFQELLNEKRVCHLHGTISNYGEIVLSKESYTGLYNDEKYENLLKVVTGSKKLLFLGFSFDDQFLKTLIQQHKKYFHSRHYILLNNPSNEKVKELRDDYGLITIPYNIDGSSHVAEIRRILKVISKPLSNSTDVNSKQKENKKKPKIIAGAGMKSFKRNIDGNLFYKKLKLEQVDDLIIDLSSKFYIAADEYIRGMEKNGMPIGVIDSILGQVFIKYQETFIDVYQNYGDSEQFLKKVHASLADINYGRHEELLKSNISNENENRGFIHILADDEEEDVWWGVERFNEE